MNSVPAVTSNIQVVMFAMASMLLVAVLFIVKLLWGLRDPIYALFGDYLGSGAGATSISSAMRNYLTTAEGKIFMEGVINGKVRRELDGHNDSKSSHYILQKELATMDQLNKGLETVRGEMGELETKRKVAINKLEEVHKMIIEDREIFDQRFTEIEELLLAKGKE